MKKGPACGWMLLALLCGLVPAGLAQLSKMGAGKDFMFPDYYPATSGVLRKKSIVTGSEYRMLTNNVFELVRPRIEFYRPDGQTLEWTAIAPECTVDIKTREVSGKTNVFFRTADDRLFVTGVGFLWQQTNSMLILSNETFTWTDVRTNAPGTNSSKTMKPLLAASLVATARLTAAEMEIPPARSGLTITAAVNVLNLKSDEVLYSNNVLVTYPPAKPGDPFTYLRCHWLTGKRGTNGQLEEIVARERVSVDRGDQHARGNFAIYTATNEMLALVGPYDPADATRPLPYIYTPQGTNQGESIIYDRRANTLTTRGAITDVAPDTMKSLSATNRAATNKTSDASPADRPKNAPPSK